MAELDLSSFGCLYLNVGGSHYCISQFQISRTIGTFTTGLVQVDDLDFHTTDKTNNVSQLFSELSAIKPGETVDCKVEQRGQAGSRHVFTGFITGFQYTFLAGSGVRSKLKLSVAGQAAKLKFGYMTDFKYISASLSGKPFLGPQQQSAISKSNYWGKALSLTEMAKKSNQNLSSDTLDVLFTKAFNQIQQQQKKYGGMQKGNTFPTQINLGNFITSGLKVANFIITMPGTQTQPAIHPWLHAFNSSFCNGLQSATIIDSINATLRLNHATVRPIGGISSPQKLEIIPSYIHKELDWNWKSLPATKIRSSANVAARLSAPDTVRVAVNPVTQWKTTINAPQISASTIFGYYTAAGNSNAPRRQITVPGPYWLYSCAKTRLGEAAEKDKDKNKKASEAKQKSQKDSIAQAKQLKSHLDSYAKTLYYDKIVDAVGDAMVWFNYTHELYAHLMQNVGSTYLFNFPVSAGKGKKIKEYYGRLTSVNFSYAGSKSPGQDSSVIFYCTFSALAQKGTPAGTLYTEPQTDLLYTGA